MDKFKFIKTSIEGVYIIEPTVFGDERGYFMETYHAEEFKEAGLGFDFVQDNQSKSKKGFLGDFIFSIPNLRANWSVLLKVKSLTRPLI